MISRSELYMASEGPLLPAWNKLLAEQWLNSGMVFAINGKGELEAWLVEYVFATEEITDLAEY